MGLKTPHLLAGATGCLALAALLAGGNAFGRVALSLSLPSLAVPLMGDPEWRGVAAHRAGDYAGASENFAELGPQGDFNRGNAEALSGNYAEALRAYDRVLARNPDDEAARLNFALVMSLYGGTEIDGVPLAMKLKERESETMAAETGESGAKAQGTGDEATNTGSSFDMPELTSSGLRRVPRIFDEKYIAASDRWLATMEDQPGVYLRARLAAERKQRLAAGTAPEDAAEPW